MDDESVPSQSILGVDAELQLLSGTSSDSNTSFCVFSQVSNEVAMDLLKRPIHFSHVVSFKNKLVLKSIGESDTNGRDTIE